MPESISPSLRAAAVRFSAGAVIPLGIFIGFSAITHYQVTRELPDSWKMLEIVMTCCALIGGYLLALRGMRSRLRADADLAGRRSVVAGVAAVGLFVTLEPYMSVGPLVNALGGVDWTTLRILWSVAPVPMAAAAGAVTALALFFPWLRPASEQREQLEFAASAPAAVLALPLAAASGAARATSRDADTVAR